MNSLNTSMTDETLWDLLIKINDEDIPRYKDLGFDLVFEYDESTRRLQPKFKDHKKSDIDQFLANELDDIEKVLATYDANGILNTSVLAECCELFPKLIESGIKIDAVSPSSNKNIFHCLFVFELRYFVEEMSESINLLSVLHEKLGNDAFFNALHARDNDNLTPLDIYASYEHTDSLGSLKYVTTFITEYSLKLKVTETETKFDIL